MSLTRPTRRQMLAGFAASPIALTGVGAFPRIAHAQAEAIGLISPNVCLVAPQTTEGPFYFDPDLVRRDITEDRTGVPLDMSIQAVDAGCRPIEGARVDIWHCDATGNYSGYATQGSDGTQDTASDTFLRGTQMTDADGAVTFRTIYPGWYRGRTTHIHYKVFLDETSVLTSQIFFPDALSQYLFQSVAPYNDRSTERDTVNANDGIAQRAGDGAFAFIREHPDRYVAALVVGVQADGVADNPRLPPRPTLDRASGSGSLVPGGKS